MKLDPYEVAEAYGINSPALFEEKSYMAHPLAIRCSEAHGVPMTVVVNGMEQRTGSTFVEFKDKSEQCIGLRLKAKIFE